MIFFQHVHSKNRLRIQLIPKYRQFRFIILKMNFSEVQTKCFLHLEVLRKIIFYFVNIYDFVVFSLLFSSMYLYIYGFIYIFRIMITTSISHILTTLKCSCKSLLPKSRYLCLVLLPETMASFST